MYEKKSNFYSSKSDKCPHITSKDWRKNASLGVAQLSGVFEKGLINDFVLNFSKLVSYWNTGSESLSPGHSNRYMASE